MTWVVEKTTRSPADSHRYKEELALIVIVNLGEGFFLESERAHKSDFFGQDFDSVNRNSHCEP